MANVIIDSVVTEFDREIRVTRDVLTRVPEAKFDWTPHAKSMSLKGLTDHVATLPGWFIMTLQDDGINFASASPPPKLNTLAEMLKFFDEKSAETRAILLSMDEAKWAADWVVANGEQRLHADTKWNIYRIWNFNHLIHHRGQLNLYLRLLDVPVATIYFNSADAPEFIFE